MRKTIFAFSFQVTLTFDL